MGGIPLGSSIGRASSSRLTKGGAPPRWRRLWTRRSARCSAPNGGTPRRGWRACCTTIPKPNRYRKLDDRGEAHLIALACSDAPEGHEHWTLRLLAGKVVELGLAPSLSYETVRLRLKKTPSSRGGSSNGGIPKVGGEFVAALEDVLDRYAEPYDPDRPVVCFDETSTQLLAEVREPLPPQPGRPRRQDYECRTTSIDAAAPATAS